MWDFLVVLVHRPARLTKDPHQPPLMRLMLALQPSTGKDRPWDVLAPLLRGCATGSSTARLIDVRWTICPVGLDEYIEYMAVVFPLPLAPCLRACWGFGSRLTGLSVGPRWATGGCACRHGQDRHREQDTTAVQCRPCLLEKLRRGVVQQLPGLRRQVGPRVGQPHAQKHPWG